jgi:hypothetical protein
VRRPEPPFDPRWLDRLAEVSSALARRTPSLDDLYLERRLELRVTTVATAPQVEECRTEGAAARWRYPSRSLLVARTGVSPDALTALLADHVEGPLLATARPGPPAEIDPPRGWLDWACDAVTRCPGGRAVVRFMCRRAAVVRPQGWVGVESPPLVRVEIDGESPAALLGVWDRARLEPCLHELIEPPPAKRWQPDSGLRLPVLLSGGTAGVLFHEVVGHLAEADLVLSGGSALATMAGATVTAATVDVVDDPTRFDLPGGFSCDDEGVVARPQPLVEQGRLVGWLCDRAGAEALASTAGRGRRAGWARPPVARLSNLLVAAGDTDPSSLESELRHGLLVTRVGGATVDPNSGRLVMRVERGYELRHGRRRRALAGFELTGGVLEVITGVDPAIGSDATADWRLGWCVKDGLPLPTGSEAPTMLVHHLEVL